MTLSTAPLEGVVVIVVDTEQEAHQMGMALARSGAAVFVASSDEDSVGNSVSAIRFR